ncbi:SAC3 family protein A [Sesamum angolense]|uniref:SAC3 family protein A n=1 Tax=Sesamum angolense TaxID=2727404 RepID=A0AAE1X6J3_9LAMI|nr:SAC3 family protein A [Sesamum angolense]
MAAEVWIFGGIERRGEEGVGVFLSADEGGIEKRIRRRGALVAERRTRLRGDGEKVVEGNEKKGWTTATIYGREAMAGRRARKEYGGHGGGGMVMVLFIARWRCGWWGVWSVCFLLGETCLFSLCEVGCGSNWVLKDVNVVKMMNQGESSDASTAVEKHQINDTHQVQSSYFPPNCAVASWSTQGENGVLSTSGYNHDQQVDPNLKSGQDGTNLVSNGSTSNPGPANVVQGYSGYAAYPNSDPYGYSSTGYAAYYNHYQQQPSQYQQQPGQYQQQPSQYQQQPSQYQQQAGQYQQQSGQYQQQPSQYQQQSSQYQQQSSQYQPQSNQSYPHHVGAYQNTGAPYQPLSSFQNTGSYAGPASYSSTYYNPGDYQTSGSYTSGNYGTQTNLWHGGQYATYSSHQYPNYTPDSTSAYSSTTAVATSQYQQHYKQWEDYYNQTQTEVSCAPGTENVSVSIASSVNNSVPSGSSGYTASNNQMPAAYTPSWRPEFSSSDLTSVQFDSCIASLAIVQSSRTELFKFTAKVPVAVSGSAPDGYWKHGASALQNDLPNSVEQLAQKPPDVTPAHESFQNQQTSTFSQGSTALYSASYQVSQIPQSSFQTGLQASEPLDSRRASKLQIPTNPRIASNLPSSISKPDKDSSMSSTGAKPAYVSVIMQKPNEKVAS